MGKRKTMKIEQMEALHLDAAGLDVSDDDVVAAVPPGRDADGQDVRQFSAFTDGIEALAGWLGSCRIDYVVMEATGVYWMPIFNILERKGFSVALVNPREVKQVPGRKTDVSDAQWLQKLAAVGFLKPAMIPEQAIRTLRVYLRQRERHIEAAMEATAHMRDALTQMNVRVDQAIRSLTGVTGMRMIAAIIAGERDPARLAELRAPGCKKSPEAMIRCLNGDFQVEQVFVLKQAYETYHHHQEKIRQVDQQVAAHLQQTMPDDAPSEPPPGNAKPEQGNVLHFEARDLLYQYVGCDLTSVPGIGSLTALTIISELGRDFKQFPSVKHFTSYLGLSPDNRISGGKILSRGRRKVRSRAAKAFRVAANSLSRSEGPLGEYFRRQRYRRGPCHAVVSTANKLARIVYHMVVVGSNFDINRLVDSLEEASEKNLKRLQRQAKRAGFSLSPLPQTEPS